MSCINCGSHNVREGQKSVTKVMMLCNDCGHNFSSENPALKHALITGVAAGVGATVATSATGQEAAETVATATQAAAEGATEATSALGEVLGWFF